MQLKDNKTDFELSMLMKILLTKEGRNKSGRISYSNQSTLKMLSTTKLEIGMINY